MLSVIFKSLSRRRERVLIVTRSHRQRRADRVVVAAFAAAALAACSSNNNSAPDASHDAGHEDAGFARFTSADCADVLLEGDSAVGAQCGWVAVSEDHGQPNGPTLALAVAVLKATGPSPTDDPIVVLTGGPGGEGIKAPVDGLGSGQLPLWRKTRDVILFDQRGTGVNKPDLNCPEYDDRFVANWTEKLSRSDEIATLVTAMRRCHDRLVGEGVNLSVYTSAQSARDVADIASALGYARYDLYGISYGTRLALTVMRDAPQHVRSVVLDSPESLEADIDTSRDAQYAFEQLFMACKADAKCDAAYPNLEQTFLDTASELDANPITVANTRKTPDGGMSAPLVVNGTRYVLTLRGGMYQTSAMKRLPSLIDGVAHGNTSVFGVFANGFRDTLTLDFAEGMGQSVSCWEEYPGGVKLGSSPDSASAPYSDVDEFDYAVKDVCAFWDKRDRDPKENEAVHSDLPTLILAGSLDPVLPPYYAEQIAGDLANSQYVLFDGFGHGVVRSETGEAAVPRCAHRMTQAFFDAPSERVDTSCRQDIPKIAWIGAN
jgi:pimeloyl-ACP methyl ester carboxylesterase